MSVSAIVLICLAALLCGAAVAVLVASHLSSRQKALLYEAQERVDELEKLLSESQSACQVLQTKNDMLLSSREDDSKRYEAALNAQKSQFDTVLAAQQAKFDETVGKMTAQLKAATEDMLKQRQKEFSDSSKENIGQVVTPLKETIEKMKQALNDTALKQSQINGEMKAGIENMMRQSEAARKSADELANALRHGNKMQGDWGEAVLDELLRSQGLTPGVHYDVQAVLKDASGRTVYNEQGSMLRPDVILHLDESRDVIIDSKVSLSAFVDYVNAETEEDRQRYLKEHIASLNQHVKELSQKDYSSYVQPPKIRMDYVIMFVPHTGALWTALNIQPDLWRKAMEKNVFIADEQTLFAALRIINMTWTQIAQVRNHEKVFELANEMIDRVGQFMKKYEDIGSALEKAQKAYEEGGRKLQPGGQSIITTCGKLQKLGARNSLRNPVPMIADSEDSLLSE
ncbi:MAG: DNA recombination protein RmuC [Candidatus Cryptobacteroides sp.]|nr:DNA recombination protein RmuC [Candidatus Cryptobacteroides sp.]